MYWKPSDWSRDVESFCDWFKINDWQLAHHRNPDPDPDPNPNIQALILETTSVEISTNHMATQPTFQALKAQAKWGYRRLLRAAHSSFQNDSYAIDQARLELRQQYKNSESVQDIIQLQELVTGIDEVATLFQHHVVQGKQNEDTGVYQVKLTDPQKQNMRKDEELSPINSDTKIPSEVEITHSKAPCPCEDYDIEHSHEHK